MGDRYKDIREVTPKKMACGIGACPMIYSATRGGSDIYLIVGKSVDVTGVRGGLAKRIGRDEVLIEVPKGLIDEM